MQQIGSGTMELIKNYLVGKYQGDSAWWQSKFGEAKSLREVLAIVRVQFPGDVPAITQGIISRLTKHNPKDSLRSEAIRDAEVSFPSLFRFRSQIPDGVDMSSPGFDAFKPRNASVDAARLRVVDWIERRGSPILVLAGVTGTGKTHLAIAAAQYVKVAAEKEDKEGALDPVYEAVLFRTESTMMGEIHLAMGKGLAEEVIQSFCEVPWLVIDELGAGSRGASGWNEATLDRIVNARWRGAGTWRGALRTLVTTNLLSKDLPPRVASRLGDRQWGGGIVTIDATDYRRSQQ